MLVSLSSDEVSSYVARQISAFFPDRDVAGADLRPGVGLALERLEFCLDRVRVKYAAREGQSNFNHLNTDQYAVFLYMLSNSLYRELEDVGLAAKTYALNKALHAIDVFYEVELPRIFLFQHPVGTVLGRGRYSDYLMVYQRCSVGSTLEGVYPQFGEGVVMFGGSAVIGDCELGANSWLSVGTLVMNARVPANSLVFGKSPNLVFKPARQDVKSAMFGATASIAV